MHHLALESGDPDALAAFYARAFGYRIEREGAFLLGRGPTRRLLFIAGRAKKLAFAAFELADAAELDRLRRRLDAAACPHEPFETPFFEDALAVHDPDRNRFVFGLSKPVGTGGDVAVPPARLQHVVTASSNAETVARFFTDVLGFTLSDVVLDGDDGVRACFLRCSHEHHSFAVFQAAESRFDHHCYETRDWNAIRDWADHLAVERIPTRWGPGRHGPGNNLFLFVNDTDGNWVELSAELEVVSHDRPFGRWPHEERTLNSWGQGLMRS